MTVRIDEIKTLIGAYMEEDTIEEAAKSVGMDKGKLYARVARLRKLGVSIPNRRKRIQPLPTGIKNELNEFVTKLMEKDTMNRFKPFLQKK